MATTAPIRDAVPRPRVERSAPKSRLDAGPVIDEAAAPAPARPHVESLFGLAASLIIHLCLLSGMAYVVFDLQKEDDVGALSGLIGTPTEPPADFLAESDVIFQAGGTKEELFNPATTAFSNIGSQIAARSNLGGDGEGDGAGDAEGDGVDINVGPPTINVPVHAVTKGSFSAWTVPEDPEPGKNYLIVIQVRLPEKFIKGGRYKIGDVSGIVTGTDGYVLPIRFNSSKKIRPEDGVLNLRVGRNGIKTSATATVQENGILQLTVSVPAANQLVRDTIQIESRLLKEEQTLEIVF